jgi:hypothetical protein
MKHFMAKNPYGQKSLLVTSYLLGASKVWEMDHTLHTREAILHIIKDNLVMTQNRMKQQEDQHCSKHYFIVGDYVFLCLQPFKQTSLKDKTP